MLLAWQLAFGSSSRAQRSYTDVINILAVTNTLVGDVGDQLTIEEWPSILVKLSEPSLKWKGPYLSQVSKDPWGNHYALKIKSKKIVGVYSYGMNGLDDNGQIDDVSSWSGYEESIYFPERKRNRVIVVALIVILSALLLFPILRVCRAKPI